MFKEYQVFRNINILNEDLANGIKWEPVAISWVDVEVEIKDDATGDPKLKVFHNPVMLMSRDLDGE